VATPTATRTTAATPQRNAAEGERGEEGLGRLDGGVAPAPEQDDGEEDRDDGGVGRAAARGPVRTRQRVFMSSGKLEEKE
jgi:hypothetical protein